jgi:hypothetical protein
MTVIGTEQENRQAADFKGHPDRRCSASRYPYWLRLVEPNSNAAIGVQQPATGKSVYRPPPISERIKTTMSARKANTIVFFQEIDYANL